MLQVVHLERERLSSIESLVCLVESSSGSLHARVDESDEGRCVRWAGTRRSSGGTTDQDVRSRLREW